jgi:hypothetical protein
MGHFFGSVVFKQRRCLMSHDELEQLQQRVQVLEVFLQESIWVGAHLRHEGR